VSEAYERIADITGKPKDKFPDHEKLGKQQPMN
jgi:hypothetical protein